MRVVIDKNFFVDIDELNYVLKELRQVKDEEGELKDSVRTIGYFTNMEQIVRRIVLVKKAQLDIETDLNGYLAEHRRLSEYVGDKISNAKEYKLQDGERKEVPPRYVE